MASQHINDLLASKKLEFLPLVQLLETLPSGTVNWSHVYERIMERKLSADRAEALVICLEHMLCGEHDKLNIPIPYRLMGYGHLLPRICKVVDMSEFVTGSLFEEDDFWRNAGQVTWNQLFAQDLIHVSGEAFLQILCKEKTDNLGVIEMCLDHGANPNQCDPAGLTALGTVLDQLAATSEYKQKLLALLIQRGADVNLPDANGRLPLHYASGILFEFLLQRGAKLTDAIATSLMEYHLDAHGGTDSIRNRFIVLHQNGVKVTLWTSLRCMRYFDFTTYMELLSLGWSPPITHETIKDSCLNEALGKYWPMYLSEELLAILEHRITPERARKMDVDSPWPADSMDFCRAPYHALLPLFNNMIKCFNLGHYTTIVHDVLPRVTALVRQIQAAVHFSREHREEVERMACEDAEAMQGMAKEETQGRGGKE